MDELDQKLKRAMQPVDAPDGFEARIMARIAREQRSAKRAPEGVLALLYDWLRRPALASGVVVVVLAGIVLTAVSWQHQRNEARQELRGRQTSAQLLLALKITGDRLSRVHQLLSDARLDQRQAKPD